MGAYLIFSQVDAYPLQLRLFEVFHYNFLQLFWPLREDLQYVSTSLDMMLDQFIYSFH